MEKESLPVDSITGEACQILRQDQGLVVIAPPGSGKTTRLAPALLAGGLAGEGQRIWLLQPRRVAARATALRIAAECGVRVGELVGYQVRFENRCGPATRLVVATEGVLLRRLESDPVLTDVAAVVLDEFHERSATADLLLAMLRRVQLAVRPDLRIVVMSATLDPDPVRRFLGDAPLLTAAGREYAVKVRYQPPRAGMPPLDHVANVIRNELPRGEGDTLVFLPGAGEIESVRRELERGDGLRGIPVIPLHGGLPLERQAVALEHSSQRRIILATNVAETSLTIPGVRTVIDSGLVRVLRFDPSVGIDRLEVEPVCRASAAQRAGRAGRVAEGVCVRLWDSAADRSRPEYLEPEIRRADLAGCVLQLLSWGESPVEFPWFERPREDAIGAALKLLRLLGATSADGTLTALGRQMAMLPLPPRLGRLVVEGHALGCLDDSALAAALLSERDPILRREDSRRGRGVPPPTAGARRDCDVTARIEALRAWWDTGQDQSPFGTVHRGAAASIRAIAEELAADARRILGEPEPAGQPVSSPLQRALLAAMPDRVAKRRDGKSDRAIMVGGRGVRPGPQCGNPDSELFLCVEVAGGEPEALVRQATAIRREWLAAELIEQRDELFFAPSSRQVQQRRREFWADLMLGETPTAITDARRCSEILLENARHRLAEVQPEGGLPVASLAARVDLLRRAAPELDLAPIDDAFLLELLGELCTGRRSFEELAAAPWLDWIRSRWSPALQATIDREAPERIRVPSGSQQKIQYEPGKPPVLAVRIQEVFSWPETPRICFGRVPLLLHLLAPNFRPQQVTDDLASFWRNTYHKVRGELRRRYPRHAWPEDPLSARPEKKG